MHPDTFFFAIDVNEPTGGTLFAKTRAKNSMAFAPPKWVVLNLVLKRPGGAE